MKNLILTIVLIGLSFLVKAQQGVVYCMYWDFTTSTEYFASLDLANGIITPINSLPGVTDVEPGTSTFDDVNRLYIVESNLGVITIDAQTGAIVDTFATVSNFAEYEFDGSNNMLYGVYWDFAASVEYFASLDLANGTITAIDSLPGVTDVEPGTSTFDDVNRLYIVESNLGVITIDAQTGAIVDTFATVSNFAEYEFDGSNNMLYGVYWDFAVSVEYFASLDLANGVITPIDSLPGVTDIEPGTSTFDDVNRLYIVESNLGVMTIDVQTGAIADIFTTVSNSNEYEYYNTPITQMDERSGKEDLTSAIHLSPNPSTNHTILKSNSLIQHVEIFNIQGKKIRSINFQNVDNIILETTQWDVGLYVLSVQTETSHEIIKLMIAR